MRIKKHIKRRRSKQYRKIKSNLKEKSQELLIIPYKEKNFKIYTKENETNWQNSYKLHIKRKQEPIKSNRSNKNKMLKKIQTIKRTHSKNKMSIKTRSCFIGIKKKKII